MEDPLGRDDNDEEVEEGKPVVRGKTEPLDERLVVEDLIPGLTCSEDEIDGEGRPSDFEVDDEIFLELVPSRSN